MNRSCLVASRHLLSLLAVAALAAGCDRRTGPAASSTTTAQPQAAAAASAPIAGVVPAAEDYAGSGVPGPGSGTTAVGGMAAQQDAGGHVASPKAPAPTGGDGAASASMPSSASASMTK